MPKIKRHPPDPFIQQLVELTFAPPDVVTGWLARIGLKIVRQEEGVTTVKNPYLGLTTAITADGDPLTRAVCLGFATAGVYWPRLYPRLLEAVNREWQRRLALTRPPKKADVKVKPDEVPAGRLAPTTSLTFETLYRQRDPT